MKAFTQLRIMGILFGLCAALLIAGTTQAAIELSGKAPDFTLKNLKGSNLKLSEHRGEVVMINFWASWCAPCRQEMPHLNDLYMRYKDLGFTLLAINVEEDSAQAQQMARELKMAFPVLFDTENKVSKMYDVSAMPSTVIVDRSGNMRFLHRGYQPGYEDEYQQQIRELIRE